LSILKLALFVLLYETMRCKMERKKNTTLLLGWQRFVRRRDHALARVEDGGLASSFGQPRVRRWNKAHDPVFYLIKQLSQFATRNPYRKDVSRSTAVWIFHVKSA
jgi:hypothetical protein